MVTDFCKNIDSKYLGLIHDYKKKNYFQLHNNKLMR